MTNWVVGVDTGGTFTDLVAMEKEQGSIYVTKVPSTPHNPAEGILGALRTFSTECGVSLEEVSFLGHGTTVATNAVLEGKGSRAGLIVTEGYRAIYDMRGGTRPSGSDLIDPRFRKPPVLVPLRLTRGVRERVAYDGQVITPLDEESVRQAARELRAEAVESIAVCLLFSFMNASHEERVAEIIRTEYPGCRVSLSSRVLPIIREYPRLSTTVLDAYVGQVVERYLHDLNAKVREAGLTTQQFYVMQSNGGLTRINLAAQHPNETLLSGPAAGVVYCARLGEQIGEKNIVTLDMGGTSTDISVIQSGQFTLTREGKIAGQEIGTPMMEIETLGAGGGTIAWIGRDGYMKVGPQSAGAVPGPACYMRGGTAPTVTDASVVLGYLDANKFLGGRMQGSAELAGQAMERVGPTLGLDAVATATGIHKIINTQMSVGLRLALTERGCDPTRFALVAFGGSGPAHAWKLAEELGIPRIIVPPHPGISCARGLLETDVMHVYMQSYLVDFRRVSLDEVNRRFEALQQRAYAEAEVEGFAPDEVELFREVDFRYPQQGYELAVACPGAALTEPDRQQIRSDFDLRHLAVYGISAPDEEAEMVNLRVRSVVVRPKPVAERRELQDESPDGALRGTRMAYFETAGGYVQTPVFDRALLRAGNCLHGPAIVEQLDSTTVIGPGQVARYDAYGNILIETSRISSIARSGFHAG